MTSDEVVEKALRLIQPMPTPEQLTALRTSLALKVDAARRALALRLHADRNRREPFRKSFTLTISAGAAALTSHLAAAEPLILDTVKAAYITSASSSYAWQWKGNRSTLALHPSGTDFIAYTLDGQTIYTDAPDASATMYAGYEPSLNTIDSSGLTEELAELLAGMAMPKEVAA